MIIAVMGLIGSGKSTVATVLSAKRDMLLFDMDSEFPEEYRDRHHAGEVVPAEDVKAYQRQMVERMLNFEKDRSVVMAGFFLDDELPRYIEERADVVWINLVTNNKNMLAERIRKRTNHFAAGVAVLEDNWPHRSNQIIGEHCVDCDRDLEQVVHDCLSLF